MAEEEETDEAASEEAESADEIRRRQNESRPPITNSVIGDWMRCIRPAMLTASTPREKLIAENLRLVPYICSKARRGANNVSDDDLQLGTMALIRCADGFDPTLNIKFSTYACKAIYFSLFRKTPAQKRNHPPTVSLDQFAEADEHNHNSGTLDTLGCLAVESPCEALVELAEAKSELAAALAAMKPRESEMVTLYYQHDFTLLQIGEIYGITRERVRQIILDGISRARGEQTGRRRIQAKLG